MLRSVNELTSYQIAALDGTAGRLRELYFDDEHWLVRYLVVDTGRWLPGRLVLISPVAVREPDWETKSIPVALTKEQIEKGPLADSAKPVSRSFEIELIDYYGWPHNRLRPQQAEASGASGGTSAAVETKIEEEDESHLRSSHELRGYAIEAANGEIGHAGDFILDDETFILRYVVVETRNWLPGRKVLVALSWVERVDWTERAIHLNLTREQVKNSPEYNPSEPVNRRYEARLYDFYGRPSYWEHQQ